MITAKEAKEVTIDKNREGIQKVLDRLNKMIVNNSSKGFNSIYVGSGTMGGTEGKIANVINELSYLGYYTRRDGYGYVISW